MQHSFGQRGIYLCDYLCDRARCGEGTIGAATCADSQAPRLARQARWVRCRAGTPRMSAGARRSSATRPPSPPNTLRSFSFFAPCRWAS